jgi:hypothetical protein
MGQQQLLLLVLGIVIVGIAIVVGINAYAENSVKSNYDALLQDGLRIASDAQAWKAKPELFGGQDDALKNDQADFTGAIFSAWGYSQANIGSSGLCYVNLNGEYLIAPTTTKLTITGQSDQHKNQVSIEVTGTLEPDVALAPAASEIQGGAVVSTGADGSYSAAGVTCTPAGS